MINTNNRGVQLADKNIKCASQKHKTSPYPSLWIDKVAGWIKSLRSLGLRIYKLDLKSVYIDSSSPYTHIFIAQTKMQ